MNEGLPSILKVIASGKTGLSEEEWIAVVEMFGLRVRSEMERVSLPRLSAFVAQANSLENAVSLLREEDLIPNQFWLSKQGLYFSSIIRLDFLPDSRYWFVWGVCREDSLWSLIKFSMARFPVTGQDDQEVLTMTSVPRTGPKEILETMRRTNGKFTYFDICTCLASFADKVLEDRLKLVAKVAILQGRFRADIELLKCLK
ncbi:MAG: hypothetical protein AAB484_02805 [Patescibacteria group bacterium]